MNEHSPRLNRLPMAGFATGAALLIASCAGAAFNPRAFFVSWLFAFIFWLGLTLGCFQGAMIHYLTGGRWGVVSRRLLEAGFMTLPLMAVLFLPILFGLHHLYPWARPADVTADHILQKKVVYENAAGFVARAVVFFAIWISIAVCLRKWSIQQDGSSGPEPTIKMRALSGPAIAVVPLTASFALIDWAMSIEPKWYSTIFPIILLSGQMLTMFAFLLMVLAGLRLDAPPAGREMEKEFHDLGNLLLAFVLFWTYVAFSQVLIIYSANEPHEISWYLRRISGGWTLLPISVAIFHFLIPFLLLLFRAVKKSSERLAAIASVLFIFQGANIFWTIEPAFYPKLTVHWTDFAAWSGMGAIWLGAFAANLRRHPLLARHDPRLEPLTAPIAHAK